MPEHQWQGHPAKYTSLWSLPRTGPHRGPDRNVIVMGGANLLGQYLNAGAVDELTVSVAPVLLGAGKRLFDGSLGADLSLEQAGVIESPFVTHLRYRLTTRVPTSR